MIDPDLQTSTIPKPGMPGFVDLNSNPAAQVTQRVLMGMLADTLMVAFTDIGGKLGIYSSEAAKPSLPPLTRTVHSYFSYTNDNKEADKALKELIGQLPENLRKGLSDNSKLPFDQRDPNFASLQVALIEIADLVSMVKAIGAVPPASVSQGDALLSKILGNAVPLLQMTQKNVEAKMNALPPLSPGRPQLGKYYALIGEAIAAAINFLAEKATAESKNQRDMAASRRDMAQLRMQQTLDAIAKQVESMKKAAEMKLIMNIVGPIITAVMAVGTICSLGLAAPAAIAIAVAFQTAAVAVSIADSCTGCVSKPVGEAFKSFMESLPGTEVEQALLAFAILIVACVILFMASSAAGSAAVKAGAGTASQTLMRQAALEVGEVAAQEAINQASKQAIRASIMDLSMTFVMSYVTATNCVAILLFGGLKNKSENDKLTAEILQMVLVLVIMLAAKGGGGYARGTTKAFSSGATHVLRTTAQSLSLMTQMSMNIYSICNNLEQARLLIEKGDIEAGIAQIDSVLKIYETSVKSIQKAVENAFETMTSYEDIFNSMMRSVSGIMTSLAQTG